MGDSVAASETCTSHNLSSNPVASGAATLTSSSSNDSLRGSEAAALYHVQVAISRHTKALNAQLEGAPAPAPAPASACDNSILVQRLGGKGKASHLMGANVQQAAMEEAASSSTTPLGVSSGRLSTQLQTPTRSPHTLPAESCSRTCPRLSSSLSFERHTPSRARAATADAVSPPRSILDTTAETTADRAQHRQHVPGERMRLSVPARAVMFAMLMERQRVNRHRSSS